MLIPAVLSLRSGQTPRLKAGAVMPGSAEHVLIDDVLPDRFAVERAQNIARGLFAHPVDRLPRHPGHMRGHDHIGKCEQRMAFWRRLLLEDVETRAGEFA